MKTKKGIVLIILILALIYDIVVYFNIIDNIRIVDYIMLILLSLCVVLVILDFISPGDKNSINKEKLYNSIIENADTVYIMVNAIDKKIMYLSKNVEKVLGIKQNRKDEDIVNEIFSIEKIKNELDSWDLKDTYLSSMFEYSNPKYNHTMWLKLKFLVYKEKKEYYVIEIIDATKEHDRQHLLITQAGDIKLRESALNEIIEKTYDMQLSINVINNRCDLKYFKNVKYFDDASSGNYVDCFNKILTCINEKDKKVFSKNLNLPALKDHFNKYELDSIIIRYRVGNEIKGNIWLESNIFFLTGKGKNTVFVLSKNVTDDAEAIREQNILLQNALMEAKKMNKTKTDLIQAISHDIRTPLTNIVGISESLLEEDIDGSIRDDISNIKISSNDIVHTIDGLMDIGKKTVKEEDYNIYKMFKEIKESVNEYIENKSLKLNIILDNNLPVVLNGDYERIKDTLTELTLNAIKYTNEGIINILVKGEKVNKNIKLNIEVNDTGIGMSQKKLDEVLSSDNNIFTKVKELMDGLSGTLEVESEENEYTKVKLSFIQKIVEDNKVRELMNNNKEAKVFDLTGKRVLVVDDNQLNLKVTKRLLKPYNVDVILLSSGQECIDEIESGNNFDLILMDQMMPVMDGVTTMKKLKKINDFNIPVIVLTADAMNGQKEKYLSEGFDDYISKPIDKKELSRVLKKYIK